MLKMTLIVFECVLALALAAFIMGFSAFGMFLTLAISFPWATLGVFLAALILASSAALLPAHAMYKLKSGNRFWQRKLIPVNLEFSLGVSCIIFSPVIFLFMIAVSELASSPTIYWSVAFPGGISFSAIPGFAFLIFLVLLIPFGVFLIVDSFRRWLKIYLPAS